MGYQVIFDYLIYFKKTELQAHQYIEVNIPHLVRPEIMISEGKELLEQGKRAS
ncbi:hypothetical protein FMO003_24530 [Moritella sp. F3]|nr:hypothetical protein FMO001_17800 [Moritella sp. F1]GIC82172.1 hypothetical protein FMO003_24530 [Moritella sp. F3]